MGKKRAAGAPDKKRNAQIENKITETFAGVASALGYSPAHGKIIAILIIEGAPMSIQDLADRLKYSLSSISLSVDFLSAIGVMKKFRANSDRKMYVKLNAGLLDTLRRAVIVKLEKVVEDSLSEFEEEKHRLSLGKSEHERKLLRTIKLLESEIKRLNSLMQFAKNINLKGQ